jgi:zinc transport system substrate-binding protein
MAKLLFLALCLLSGLTHAEPLRPQVFVSIPPQKQFIQKIAGGKVLVEVMLPPGESPETFSPSPKLIASLANAVSYFQVGVPFEKTWADSIMAANRDIRIIQCCDQISGSQDQQTGERNDVMHIWTNPIHVQKLAKIILDELIRIDPSHSDVFTQNYNDFFSGLAELDISIEKRLSRRKTDYFIVSHSAWTAFADNYGLIQLALEKNGKEIGPRSLLEIIRLARLEGLKKIFVMEQYRTPFIDNLAAELDAEVINIDPLAEDYITNMNVVAGKIAGSLITK